MRTGDEVLILATHREDVKKAQKRVLVKHGRITRIGKVVWDHKDQNGSLHTYDGLAEVMVEESENDFDLYPTDEVHRCIDAAHVEVSSEPVRLTRVSLSGIVDS